MKPLLLMTLLAVALLLNTAVADPPKIVSTSPEAWATNVNSGTQKTLSLTFDQPMRPSFADWFGMDVLSPPSSLHTTFNPDRMSCTVDVRLLPGKVYVCGINERGVAGVGFQSAKGVSVLPTYVVFQTQGVSAPEDAPPHVKSTMPANGAQVDASKATAIVVAFDATMATKKHGLRVFENDISIDVSKASFSYSPDARTFTLQYRFKPATQYRLELNSVQDIGFSASNRVPLWPTRVAFGTAPAQ